MKKIIFIIFFFLGFNVNSQQLEIGPTIGYWFDNIVNCDNGADNSVIGKALWNTNMGISAIYYFKKPDEVMTGRIGLLYRNSKKGSVSEINEIDKFEFNIDSFALIGGIARDVGEKYILYFDVGLSYNIIDDSDSYKGTEIQTNSFPKLENELEIKKNEFGFLFGIGVEREINQNLKFFIELNGDAGISKINETSGNFRTQSFGFGTGIRYIIEFNKK